MSVFGNKRSPYFSLMRWAGIEYGDIEKLVLQDGLERTLEILHESGIYVTLDEFKGRKPILRPGLERYVQHGDFDNPYLVKHFEGRTGGSRGVSRRVSIDLALILHDAATHHLFLEGFRLKERPMSVWRPHLPDSSGIRRTLFQVKTGHQVEHWFAQNRIDYQMKTLKFAISTHYTCWLANILGKKIPLPEYTPLEKAHKVAFWLAKKNERQYTCTP
ncbi:hypothetical protein ACFLRM_06635 [Acidobacteriota bacterium]